MKKHLGWVLAALVIIGCGGKYRGSAAAVTTGVDATNGTTNTTSTGITATSTDGSATGTTGTSGQLVYAVASNGHLVTFRTNAPATLVSNDTITGPPSGDAVAAIDYDASGGNLYGMSGTGRLYRLTAIGVGYLAFPIGQGFGNGITGTVKDIDFDPASGNIRVAVDGNVNLRVSTATGTVTSTDAPFVYAGAGNAVVAGIAYAPTASAFPFYAFAGYDQLTRSSNPSGGNLDFYNTNANLPTNGDVYGLDINASGLAILSVDGANGSTLVTVNTATGVGQSIGATASGLHIRSLCFAP